VLLVMPTTTVSVLQVLQQMVLLQLTAMLTPFSQQVFQLKLQIVLLTQPLVQLLSVDNALKDIPQLLLQPQPLQSPHAVQQTTSPTVKFTMPFLVPKPLALPVLQDGHHQQPVVLLHVSDAQLSITHVDQLGQCQPDTIGLVLHSLHAQLMPLHAHQVLPLQQF
jgi:hypothetical protein